MQIKANTKGFSHHLLLPILAVFVVGGIGTYMTFSSKAATSPCGPGFVFVKSGSNTKVGLSTYYKREVKTTKTKKTDMTELCGVTTNKTGKYAQKFGYKYCTLGYCGAGGENWGIQKLSPYFLEEGATSKIHCIQNLRGYVVVKVNGKDTKIYSNTIKSVCPGTAVTRRLNN